MFEEASKYDMLNCFSCKSSLRNGKASSLYKKGNDTKVCSRCGGVLEQERHVLPGITSNWFDARWVEDTEPALQWQQRGVTIARACGEAGDAVREVLGPRRQYPFRDVIMSSPFQPGLLSGSDTLTLKRLKDRLQQEAVMEASFLPFPEPDSQEMGDHLAKKCFEAMAMLHQNISDLYLEAQLFKSKSGKPLRQNTPTEDLEPVFAPLRPFTQIEHPGLGMAVSMELSDVFKQDEVVIPYGIYNQHPLEEIPEHRKREMLGDLALQALYHDVDEGCLVLFSKPEGDTDGPVFAVLTVQGLRSYLLETTESWFDTAPELPAQLSRFALRTLSKPLHSEWQEDYL